MWLNRHVILAYYYTLLFKSDPKVLALQFSIISMKYLNRNELPQNMLIQISDHLSNILEDPNSLL